MALILAIDQGTTSSRAIAFDQHGAVRAVRQRELNLHYPQRGWVEQDANEILADTLWACREVLGEVGESTAIAGIGITNQRETTVLWDRATGKPLHNAIVWQDRRTAQICEQLKNAGHEADISARTGLLLDPYFSGTKLGWLLDHVPGARARAEAGELAFGTIDCFLLWHLSGGKVHASDATNASRTLLFNIHENTWDPQLLSLLGIPAAVLPEVRDNVGEFGTTAQGVLQRSLTIGGMAGDQQAALIGQACFEPGMVKSTYGTGCFALMNTGTALRPSRNRLLNTIAYRLDGQVHYAIEGSIFVAGAAIQWLRDGLGLFANATESEALARSVDDNNGVYFVPAFTGLGAPYWQPEARAQISGLGRESTGAHITRAALEAQAYQSMDLVNAMQADTGTRPEVIRADGGLMANTFVGQFLADMLDIPIEVPQVTESTAWGAACLAGLHAGVFDSLEQISNAWQRERTYQPQMASQPREQLYAGWQEAVARLRP